MNTKLFESVQERIDASFLHLHIPKKSKPDIYIVLTFIQIVELAREALILFNNKRSVSLEILLRSQFESMADLINILRSPEYAMVIELNSLKQEIITLQYLIKQTSQDEHRHYLSGILSDKTQRKDYLLSQGTPQLKIVDKFRKAGIYDEYEMLYAHLCSRTHGNEIALVSNFIEFNEDLSDYTIVIANDLDDNKSRPIINTILKNVLSAAIDVHKHYKTCKCPHFRTTNY